LKRARLALRFATFACALGFSLASVAHAEPSIWQRANQPERGRNQILLNRIERMLGTVGLPEFNAEFSAGAVALFQLSDARWRCEAEPSSTPASASPAPPEPTLDPRLEYLIGGALLEAQTDREPAARCILERALRDAPESPLAAEGYFNLALVAGKLGDRKAERAAYLHALEVTWDTDIRANVYGNLAESDMGAGDLKRAVREYRVAVEVSERPDSLSLAYYGLAVALDRSGDLPSALEAAKRAISVQLPATLFSTASVLDLPTVSFSPSYEIHYYKALGAMAAAILSKDPALRREALADAVEQWTAYLVRAEADHAPWVQPARLHKASVERELAKLAIPRAKPAEKSLDELTAPLTL
jgi:tetratricopeptide (TPR) repeat protein